jgi:mannose-6-phosphate isomerase-like protein (cupin superfamily)
MQEQTAMVPQKPIVLTLKNDGQYQPLLEGVPQTCGMRAGRVYLEPGGQCGEHTTGGHEETLVFLAGRGLAYIQNHQPLEVEKNLICYIPPYTRHNIENTGDEPLVYIYCVAPIQNRGSDNE